MITQSTLVSRIDRYLPMYLSTALPGLCIGVDIDDAWLLKQGIARVSAPFDYVIDQKTQITQPLQQPAYNAATNLWDAYQVASINLSVAIEIKCDKVDGIHTVKVSQGAHWNNILFQINEGSETKFAGAGAYALGVVNSSPGAKSWPQNFVWTAADNSLIPMTAAQAYDFTQTMAMSISALAMTKSAIKLQLRAAPDLATLNSIDITKNWPTI